MATRGRAHHPGHASGARTIDVDIESLSAEGDGIARMGRTTLRVPFTIPGERVRVAASPRRAMLVDVLDPSPHRVTPKCAHFGVCGGCAWQHIEYAEQLRLKTALLDRVIRARVRPAPSSHQMLAAGPQPWGFRQKVHFVFGEGSGRPGRRQLVMGHFARGSRHVVDVRECPVHDERGNDLAFALRREVVASGATPAGSDADGALKSITIRTALKTDEVLATVVVAHDGDRRLRTATRRVIEQYPNVSFHLNEHPRDDGFIFGKKTRTLVGAEKLRDEIDGVSYLMSPTSFFQTNAAAASMLVSEVLRTMPEAPARVLDLYAGAGLFSIPLARAGHRVTAVESNRQAVADGMASVKLNGLTEDRCRFIAARTEEVLARRPRADVTVLDPPREGCGREVVDLLFGHVQPALVVYVSCDPASLADDLERIVSHGYTIRSLQPIDMFPHTPHIETVAVLTR